MQQRVKAHFNNWKRACVTKGERLNYDESQQGADKVMYEVWKQTFDNVCLAEWARMAAHERQVAARMET